MIQSTSNPLIRQVLKLQQKAGERRKKGLFVAEGRREVSLALKSAVVPAHLLVCHEIFNQDDIYPIDLETHADTLREVSRTVYNRLAYRTDHEGVIMVGHQIRKRPGQLPLGMNPLVLVLEGLEKPGNLGAIMRTADAAGVDALVLADSTTDIYNPNVIRASLGCLFTVQVAVCTSEEAIGWIQNPAGWPGTKTPTVVAAALQTDQHYFDTDMRGPTVIAFGTEDKGLSEPWRTVAGKPVRIPMMGDIDSLNVSVSVAILTYEAVRQRHGS